MQHEIILLLSSHPSPLSAAAGVGPSSLSSSSTASTLLHPGERASIQRLTELAQLHSKVSFFCTPRLNEYQAGLPSDTHLSAEATIERLLPTTALAALRSLISTRILRAYSTTLLALEQQILQAQLGTAHVPLSHVLGEMTAWESLLLGIVRLIDSLLLGPEAFGTDRSGTRPQGRDMGKAKVAFQTPTAASFSASTEKPPQRWTCAPLLSLLDQHVATGDEKLRQLWSDAIKTIEKIWLSSFCAYLLWGQIDGVESLVVRPSPSRGSKENSPHAQRRSTTTQHHYHIPEFSIPYLGPLVNPPIRATILKSLSTISLALAVLHSISTADSAELSQILSSSSSLSNIFTVNSKLKAQLEEELRGCTGPGDDTFGRRLDSVAIILSTHLLTLNLPPQVLHSQLDLLSSTYLLRCGSFASNLLHELSILRARLMRTAGTIASARLNDTSLASAMSRASIGTILDPDLDPFTSEDALNRSPFPETSIKAFKLTLLQQAQEEDALMESEPFTSRLLGPPLALDYQPSPALALLIDEDCLSVYKRCWALLIAVKGCHARLLATRVLSSKLWSSLAHSQRSSLKRQPPRPFQRKGIKKTEHQLDHLRASRGIWNLVRSMLWTLEAVSAHFQTDVIEQAFGTLMESLKNAEAANAQPSDEPSEAMDDSSDNFAPSHSRCSSTSKPPPPPTGAPPRALDFADLATLHALYLSVISTGLFLNNDQLTAQILAILEACDVVCSTIDRWGGEVRPGLLGGPMSEEDVVRIEEERNDVIQEWSQEFDDILDEFFELLSTVSTNPSKPDLTSTSFGPSSASMFQRSALPLLPGAKTSSSTSATSARGPIHPLVAQARSDAEQQAREGMSKLLLRLDFGHWFSSKSELKREGRRDGEDDRLSDGKERLLSGLKI
ncbi:BQ2448_2848 [Microbotryum intermedium]|uniref:Spindle pole body component n=1 Tax=Microbotryum intermedium TaxID=269621 RepID=A0A238FBN7_9BASI|nr:BQ2448_2848 [Microbotryum intermedium]